MTALGWTIDRDGDYCSNGHPKPWVYLLAPYWDETQPLIGRRREGEWRLMTSNDYEPGMPAFPTPEAGAVYCALVRANN